MASPEYPKTAVNKLGRLPKRGAYDYATVHSIINTSPILHVSFVDPEHPFPVVLPMLGCTAKFDNQDADTNDSEQDIFIHGYVSGRIFRQGRESGEEGLPVTVAASFMDGLVLALAPFLAYGYATLVTDEAERLYAMTKITNNILPSRWEKSRSPPTPTELKSTSILRIKISSASAKVHTGGPSDDRKDLKDESLRASVWTGVVPSWLQWGEPVAGKDNGYKEKTGETEEYIEKWRLEENERNRRLAYQAVERGS